MFGLLIPFWMGDGPLLEDCLFLFGSVLIQFRMGAYLFCGWTMHALHALVAMP